MSAVCTFCGDPVNPDDMLVLRRVTGWEQKRRQGGTNALIARQPLEQFACPSCGQKLKRGVDPNQPSLL